MGVVKRLLAGFCAVCLSASAWATDDDSVQKTVAIKKLYAACGAKKMTQDSMSKLLLDFEKRYKDELVQQYISRDKLSQEQAISKTDSVSAPVLARLEKILAESNFERSAELTLNLSIDKNFTLDEIQFLLDFHESPVGKRMSQLNQQFAQIGQTVMAKTVEPYLKRLEAESSGGAPAGKFEAQDSAEILAKISPEKRDLLKNFVSITHIGSTVHDMIINVEQNRLTQAKQVLDTDKSIGESERAEIMKRIENREKYVKLISTRLDWNAAFEPGVLQGLDALLSVEDLKHLNIFYGNPKQVEISKKLVSLSTDSIEMLNKLWLSDLMKALNEAKAGG